MVKSGDFYEDDEPVEDLIAAFERGRPLVTSPNPASDTSHGWCCKHYSLTSSHDVGRPTSGCGCVMTPLHSATR
jgi:hypothetical protein